MSISSNYPSIRPSLLLDFARSKALDPRITFTRSTTATYYDGETEAKAEENLLLRSQDFTTTWTKTNANVTADTETAPDGTTTADTITDDSTYGGHRLNNVISMAANTLYTASCFLKENTLQYAYVTLHSDTSQNYAAVVVDLNAGTITQTSNGTSASNVSSSIVSAGNGWYRVSITAQASAGFSRVQVGLSDTGTPSFNIAGVYGYVGSGSTIYAWGAQLEQRSSVTAYTPTTTQPVTNYIPVLLTANAGAARFDHDPLTGLCKGLLIEEQRTNSFLYSDQTDNGYWTKTNVSITSNTVVAPNGTVTGNKLVEDTSATIGHAVLRTIVVPASTAYTASIYAKAGERQWLGIRTDGAGASNSGAVSYFDLSNGTLGSAGTNQNQKIESVGNGWYRCSISITSSTAGGSLQIRYHLSDGNAGLLYTGDGTSGVYIWGAQLEAGAFPTSYIPTTTATVTRNRDLASMTGTNFSSWFNNAEGTLYSKFTFNGISPNNKVINFDDGVGYANSIDIYGNNGLPRFDLYVSATSQAALIPSGGALSVNTFAKFVGAYKVNDFAACRNGGTVVTDTSGTIPVVSRACIGNSNLVTQYLNGHISKVAYYPVRLTNDQLQALTR